MSERSDAALLARLSDTQQRILAALDRIERNQADPEEIRQAIADITSGYVLTAQMAEVAQVQRQQILEVVGWIQARMGGDELRDRLDNLAFVSEQLGSISRALHDELVLMRADVRELRAAIELAIGQMPHA